MKIQCEALKRGTAVSPSTGGIIHFNPDARRELSRAPLIPEEDVEFFVENGWIAEPDEDARRVSLEEERLAQRADGEQARDARRADRLGGRASAERRARRSTGGGRATERVKAVAELDAAQGPQNSGLDTKQSRNFDPASRVAQVKPRGRAAQAEEKAAREDSVVETEGRGDPEAPPAAGASAS